LVAEVVLRHFDETRNPKHLRYFRYVDDIRLFARDEESLRSELVKLDVRSKEVGLFPQASKVDIHRVISIENELKSLSQPSEFTVVRKRANQAAIRSRLVQLTPRYHVENPTRFKFVLGAALPHSSLMLRVLEVVRRQPHLYEPVFHYVEKARHLSLKVSQTCMELLQKHDVYPAFAAALIRAVENGLHRSQRVRLL
jgi:hypothetical protein